MHGKSPYNDAFKIKIKKIISLIEGGCHREFQIKVNNNNNNPKIIA
jgi:hypothetical protein